MDEPLYTLGGVTFTSKTRPLSSLDADTEASWAVMDRIGSENPIQFTGMANKRITLTGVTFPTLGMTFGSAPAGVHQIEELESLQKEGIPYPLVDGTGTSYGLWAIVKVSESKTKFLRNGKHLVSSYNVELIRYVSEDVGEDGIVSGGSFDISKWRSTLKDYIGGLTRLFQ